MVNQVAPNALQVITHLAQLKDVKLVLRTITKMKKAKYHVKYVKMVIIPLLLDRPNAINAVWVLME
jgi:hypothetical protein